MGTLLIIIIIIVNQPQPGLDLLLVKHALEPHELNEVLVVEKFVNVVPIVIAIAIAIVVEKVTLEGSDQVLDLRREKQTKRVKIIEWVSLAK